MKSRTGYVSNSSSSSFTLVGIVVNGKNLAREFGKKNADKIRDTCCEDESLDNGLEIEMGIEEYEEDDYIIGLDFHDMKDEETLKEFKEKVLKLLVEAGWKPNKYNRIEIACDSGYRG